MRADANRNRGFRKMRKISAADVLSRLIPALGLKTDSELAKLLDTTPSTISGWRKRNSVPFTICAKFAEEHGWSLDWLMFGDGTAQGRPTTSNQVVAENPREEAVLTMFRAISDEEQQDIQKAIEGKKRMQDMEQRLKEITAILMEKRVA